MSQELELAYMSIDTLKAQVHNLQLEVKRLKALIKTQPDSNDDRRSPYSHEYDERIRTGIGGGPGY